MKRKTRQNKGKTTEMSFSSNSIVKSGKLLFFFFFFFGGVILVFFFLGVGGYVDRQVLKCFHIVATTVLDID